MSNNLSSFAARLREYIQSSESHAGAFDVLALELFALQFQHNTAYRKICESRHLTPSTGKHWAQIPAVPTSLFKELELTSLAPAERTAVFHSSGTTEQKPSRHFHNADSLAVYETSLWQGFKTHFDTTSQLICLTPPPAQAPHSSLIHMFEVVRHHFGAPPSAFLGQIDPDGTWTLDYSAVLTVLTPSRLAPRASLLLGTAFSFVHLLDHLVENNLHFELPAGSRVMETGGYKNRSRTMPKSELHALITARLGIPRENIICEYGMSELSSQAYDAEIHPPSSTLHPRCLHFPPWARVQIISPETGREVTEGATGLIRIFDLANIFSVAAIQTEDLGIRRGDGFELIGRAQLAEPRGCSLMTA
ncbi:MAG TPA: hypothetical protein VG347_16590 [Verrucomicrobiae bacterium]|nr:hypothetical protein [Verrucomicrobiae bacterium]